MKKNIKDSNINGDEDDEVDIESDAEDSINSVSNDTEDDDKDDKDNDISEIKNIDYKLNKNIEDDNEDNEYDDDPDELNEYSENGDDIDECVNDTKHTTATSDIKYITGDDRISMAIITKYETVRMISVRTTQLTMGAKPLLNIKKDISYREMAINEFIEKILPFNIVRPMPNGGYELWKLSELNIDYINIDEMR